ncbi:hypothetical protein Noda2021_04870 [Candidatus Dependentiae bacterium Noda2021]|nr:hypothetical protein Noda2021_04870 [Candidatus Dependentiae bacterium Noda2021]
MTIISAQNKKLLRMPNIEKESPDIVCLQHTGKDDGELAYFKRRLEDAGYCSVEQTVIDKITPLINIVSFKSSVIKFYSYDVCNNPHSVSVSLEKNNQCIRVVSTLPDQHNALVSQTEASSQDALAIYSATLQEIEEINKTTKHDTDSFATTVPSTTTTYHLCK